MKQTVIVNYTKNGNLFQQKTTIYLSSSNKISADFGSGPKSAEKIQAIVVGVGIFIVFPIHFIKDLVAEGGFDGVGLAVAVKIKHPTKKIVVIPYHRNTSRYLIVKYRVEGGYFIHPRRGILCAFHLCPAAQADCGGLFGKEAAGGALIFVLAEQMRLPDPMRCVCHVFVPLQSGFPILKG